LKIIKATGGIVLLFTITRPSHTNRHPLDYRKTACQKIAGRIIELIYFRNILVLSNMSAI